tara:strand:+ start:3610 stop:3945 length:336 start_codon:yes stop_codon:yes gene_type:complete
MKNNGDLVPIKIDLTIGDAINESWLAMFGGAVQTILGGMFGARSPALVPVNVVGSPSQIKSFEKALGSEAKYLRAINKYGLDDPKVTNNKAALDKAIKSFKKETGIVWPFK